MAQFAGDKDAVTGTGARAQDGFALRNLAGDDDVGSDLWGGGNVAACELNLILHGEVMQALEKFVGPALRECGRKAEGEEAGQGLAAHSSYIAQAAGQTAMADGARGVPFAAEVYVFNGEVGGDKQFVTGREAEDGAIVADATDNGFILTAVGEAADGGDKLFFGGDQCG